MHFIVMAGLRGYMPNYCDVCPTLDSAVESLAGLHELGRDRKRKLKRQRFLKMRPQDGNEYCEIEECSCSEPWVHQDGQSKESWVRDYGEEFGLTVTVGKQEGERR